jgi:hypothetical protein
MRITGADKNEIFSKYMQLNEDVGLGPNVNGRGMMKVTTIGDSDSAAAVQRRPSAAAAGSGNLSVGGVQKNVGPGAENNEEEACGPDAVDMAKRQLLNIANRSIELFENLHNGGKLEPWVASKITLAEDYIITSSDYVAFDDNKKMPPVTGMVDIETEEFPN